MPNCIYHCEAPSLVDGRAFSFCVSYIKICVSYIKWPKGHLTLYVWVLFIYVFIYLCWCSVQVFVVGSRSRKEGAGQEKSRAVWRSDRGVSAVGKGLERGKVALAGRGRGRRVEKGGWR